MVESPAPATSTGNKPVEWCPVCGTNLGAKSSGAESDICPSCGFDLLLVKTPKTLFASETTPVMIPRFAYVALSLQVGLSILLGILFYFFASTFYIGLPQLLAFTLFLSAAIIVIFYVLMRMGRGVSVIRIGLLIFGFFTVPLGGCAIAAALSISTVSRYCVICGKKIGWGASYSECPHCQSSVHRWGRCRLIRTDLIAKAWGREPTRFEIDNTCPQCFESIRPVIGGGEKA
jgi:Zn finger protein HypA/HybF involved in hydrogenase expression